MSRPQGRIAAAFAEARAEGRAALVIYTTAGHPQVDRGLEALIALADAGTDVLELGVPFSDPLADGPVIQKSSFDAIEGGVDLVWTLDLLRRFRRTHQTPVVLFSYLNPILDFGVDRFLAEAAEAGADGVLLTDLPLGSDAALEARFEESPLDLIRLIAPTTNPERARQIADASQGFAYYISRTGVTGATAELSGTLLEELAALRSSTSTPIAVGFGISRPEQAMAVGNAADGVIVGSALVDALAREGIEGGARLVAGLRDALSSGAKTPVSG